MSWIKENGLKISKVLSKMSLSFKENNKVRLTLKFKSNTFIDIFLKNLWRILHCLRC